MHPLAMCLAVIHASTTGNSSAQRPPREAALQKVDCLARLNPLPTHAVPLSFEWYLAKVVPSMFAPLKRLVSSHSAISVGLVCARDRLGRAKHWRLRVQEHEEKLVRYCLGYGNNDPHFSQRLQLEVHSSGSMSSPPSPPLSPLDIAQPCTAMSKQRFYVGVQVRHSGAHVKSHVDERSSSLFRAR